MEKLTIKLPAVANAARRSHRISSNNTSTKSKVDYSAKSSAQRVAAHRERNKNNPDKLKEMRLKKKEQNKKYKEKLKRDRKESLEINEKCKKMQRQWTKKWRAVRKNEDQKEEEKMRLKQQKRKENTTKATSISPLYSTAVSTSMSPPYSSPRARKRAERIRDKLPKTPKSWANTVNHIIRNAPKETQSLLLDNVQESEVEQDTTANKIGLTGKPGRPRSEQTLVKKQLFSNLSPTTNIPKRSVNQYLRRKTRQMKRSPTKSQKCKIMWTTKVEQFLIDNSRCMPNKKDTILIDGIPVAKRQLLSTKYKIYMSFKESHPHFSQSFTTFRRMIPRNFRVLDASCRRVCVCTKDYNLDQKVDAVNKLTTSMKMPSVKFTTVLENCPSILSAITMVLLQGSVLTETVLNVALKEYKQYTNH